ncbi:MAG: CDP-alcohol phosphatidyltransferase family protein [Kiritimatiellae bacterium]|nr:CDP-alcohol phosphatidyltransferase family protein [Kiritimatiellia bacterium]
MSSRSAIVNGLTFFRVPLIFAWLVFAVVGECRGSLWFGAVAAVAMLLSGLTDAFDGWLARKWNVVSPLGKMADPLMDKVFYVVAFPALTWLVMRQGESAVHGLVMLMFTILYILRDLWVTFMRSVGAMYGADVAARAIGKVRTALSFPAAGWVYTFLWLHALVPAEWQCRWLWSCYAVECAMILLNAESFRSYTVSYLPYLKRALERK